MPKRIRIPCPLCRGEHLLTQPDGRGKPCPRCKMAGFLWLKAEDVANCLINKAIRTNETKKNIEE
jgi:phage FluMu protein Com